MILKFSDNSIYGRLLSYFISLYRVILNGGYKSNLYINENEKKILNIYMNGPSLREVDIKRGDKNVKNMFCNYSVFDDSLVEYIDFYIAIDPKLFENDKKCIKIINNTGNLEFIFPLKYQEIIKNYGYINSIKYTPISLATVDVFDKFTFYLMKKGFVLPTATNVLIAAIFWGINSGFKKINIYGTDFNMFNNLRVDSNNKVYQSNNHFYDEDSENLVNLSLKDIFAEMAVNYQSFEILSEYAIKMEVKITNMYPKSLIDTFKK